MEICLLNSKYFLLSAGEMMLSVYWYYRPQHVYKNKKKNFHPQELYASKHKDVTYAACIEDKCFVLSFNEYARFVSFCNFNYYHTVSFVFRFEIIYDNVRDYVIFATFSSVTSLEIPTIPKKTINCF